MLWVLHCFEMKEILIWTLFLMELCICTAQVNVFLQTKPVRYGDDLNLECSSLQYHEDWHWFKNDVLLFRNNLPTTDLNLYKYEEKKIDDIHRLLIIHSFEIVDIDRYLCTNGIFDDFIDLSQESRNFIYLDNSTKSTVQQQETKYGINITADVSNVSPMPVCHLEVENKIFPVNISRTFPQKAITSVVFQTIVIDIAFFCRQPGKPFMFVCDIGGIAIERNFMKCCSDFLMRKDKKPSSTLLIWTLIGVGCLLFVCSCGAVLYTMIKKSLWPCYSNMYESREFGVDEMIPVSEHVEF